MKSALIKVGLTYKGGPNAEPRTIKEIVDYRPGYGDVPYVRFTTPSDPFFGSWCSIGRFIGWAKTVTMEDGTVLDKWSKPA